ncbi:MAG: hypothetical protein ACK2T4_06735 [Candidatus Promineifilaceae bacterium]|jgi:hypothetical protein
MSDFPITPGPSEGDSTINYSVGIELQRFSGSTLIIGDTVFLSDEGVEVLASDDGSYYAVNAYSFRDTDGAEIGGMYARDDAGNNVVGFRVIDEVGRNDDTTLEIASTSSTNATAVVELMANRDGEGTDTYIHLERSDSAQQIDILTPSSGRVRIGRYLQLLGPDSDLCDIYIKDSNFIIKFNDGGTTRYKYLNLSRNGTA